MPNIHKDDIGLDSSRTTLLEKHFNSGHQQSVRCFLANYKPSRFDVSISYRSFNDGYSLPFDLGIVCSWGLLCQVHRNIPRLSQNPPRHGRIGIFRGKVAELVDTQYCHLMLSACGKVQLTASTTTVRHLSEFVFGYRTCGWFLLDCGQAGT